MRTAVRKCDTCSFMIKKRAECQHCLKDQLIIDKIGLYIYTAFISKLSKWIEQQRLFVKPIRLERVGDLLLTVQTLYDLFDQYWLDLTADISDSETIVLILSESAYFKKQCNELDPGCTHLPDILKDPRRLMSDLAANKDRWIRQFEKWIPKLCYKQNFITPGDRKFNCVQYFRL